MSWTEIRKVEDRSGVLDGVASKGLASVWSGITVRYALAVALGVALVALPIVYAVLASGSPGAALISTSAVGLVAVGVATFLVWPMERKITWQRQVEVLGYRLLAALAAYLVAGFVILFLLNTVTDRVVPLDWPTGFMRRLPFWPFYTLVVLGCQGILPTPPGAC